MGGGRQSGISGLSAKEKGDAGTKNDRPESEPPEPFNETQKYGVMIKFWNAIQ